MTDSTAPHDDTDRPADSDSTEDAGIDQIPSSGDDDSAGEQNAPLPDWGPTDGTHGVDGTDPEK